MTVLFRYHSKVGLNQLKIWRTLYILNKHKIKPYTVHIVHDPKDKEIAPIFKGIIS
jgi:hypothetical protein